jgi:peptidoglycan/LPS O-acetylase OafA/YrhL
MPLASSWYAALDQRPLRLDGLRGVAILLVMLYHLLRYPLARTPLDHAVTSVFAMGWSGVDLFFVLSGFLITSILLRSKGSARYFRTFYARRAIRILPLYYAVLVLYLVIFPRLTPQAEGFWIGGADRETLWYWLFLSNLHQAFTGNWQHHFLEVTWSLAIEEQFYLVWPWLVAWTSRRRLIQVCAAILVAGLALRAAIVLAGTPNPIFLYAFTPCRLDTLAVGALVAALGASEAGIAWLSRWARPALFGAGGLFVAFVIAVRLHVEAFVDTGGLPAELVAQQQALAFTATPFMQTLGFTLIALAFAGLLVRTLGAAPGSVWRRALESRLLVSLGKYSYGLYLLHGLGAELGHHLFFPDRYPGGFLVAQAGYWIAAIGCSWLLALASWHLLEAPFQRLRRHLPYREPEPAARV